MPGRCAGALCVLVAMLCVPVQAGPARADFRRPVAFEANAGQTDPRVKFVARASGYMTADSAVLAHGGESVRMSFLGAKADARIIPVDRLPGGTNYLLGRDPSRWRTGMASYARVRYEELYRGIDVVFYGNDRELEYDLIVRPGADPRRIRMALDGARKLEIAGGDLVAHTSKGQVRFRKPAIYQAAAEGRPARTIEGRYRLAGRRTVAFDVADYDRTRSLVIDPVVVYSTYLGGSDGDVASGRFAGGTQMIAVDATGAAYVTGTTDSLDFPTTAGSFKPVGQHRAAFVAKIAPDGASLVYSTYLGGTRTDLPAQEDFGAAIAVDASGSAYITGYAGSVDFPTTMQVLPGPRTMFLVKLDPTGSSLVYSRLFGGYTDVSSALVVDAFGNAYVTGRSRSNKDDFPITPGAYQDVCRCITSIFSAHDAFVAKFDAGAAQVWATFLGGSGDDQATGIAINAAGEPHVTGRTDSPDFPAIAPAQAAFGGGRTDVFVTKLSADGTALVFSTYLGGSDTESRDLANAIAVDASGNAYVAGHTLSSNFPTTPGAFQPTFLGGPPGSKHAFVTKYGPGGAVAYSTYLGAMGSQGPEDVATSVAADATGRAYVVGSTSSQDFPTVDATQPSLACGAFCSQDAFLSVLDASGSSLEFSTYLGGASFDQAQGVALGPLGSVYVMGGTLGNFPTQGALQPTSGGGEDLFVTKISIGLSPSQIVANLIAEIVVLDFQQGSHLLQNVLSRLDAGQTGAACGQLGAFINQVRAQAGKKLTESEAARLIQAAIEAKGLLGCP